MTTFAARASPSQARILRIVEGAVLNTADAHRIPRDKRLARSIAKRAAGTLTSQWTSASAADARPSESGIGKEGLCRACECRKHVGRKHARRERAALINGAEAVRGSTAASAGPPYSGRRAPLLELWARLAGEMRRVRRSGDAGEIAAYIRLLRLIDELHRDSILAEGGDDDAVRET